MIEVYKIVNGIYDSELESILNLVHQPVDDHQTQTQQEDHIGPVTRGHRLKLKKRHVRLNIGLYSFSQRVVSRWNELPEDVVTAPSLNCFKNRLDKLWTNHPLMFNWEEDETSTT